jgi:FtsP/CotA-like multicopper oxidase with cupredoxin domain
MSHKEHTETSSRATGPVLPSATRRGMFKMGAAALPLAAATAQAKNTGLTVTPGLSASPYTTPFLEAMPIIAELTPRAADYGPFKQFPSTIKPNRATNPATNQPYEGRGDDHQHRALNPPANFFVQRFGIVPPHSIHPNLPMQVNFWGSNRGGTLAADPAITPMPTIVARYKAGTNTSVLVRRINELPSGAPSGGFGKNSVSIHTHNFHSGPDSDGGPCDPALGALSESPLTQGRFMFPGQYYDQYFNMKRAGFTKPGTPDGDVRESLGTMWYHDHREAHTAENCYKGLAGFFIAFNEYDTGDERTGFKLPSYPKYDIPIIVTDLAIDPLTGQAAINLSASEGHLGDKYLVNGKIQPFSNVEKRRYRFRLLDMGPSRFYQLFLVNPDNPAQVIPYWRISNDGNLYEKPLRVTSVKLAVAERADIILDFAALTAPNGPAPGATRLRLENRLVQDKPEGPKEGVLLPAGGEENALIEFRIGALPAVADQSADPAKIVSFAPILLPVLAPPEITRTFAFGKGNGGWVVNGELIDCSKIRFTMKRGRTERWIFKTGGGWAHPVHNHFVEGRIVKRNGRKIGPGDQEWCRKDVVTLYPGDEVEYIVTATDFVGVYPMHCHNVVHEDYGMMMLFRVDDVGDNKTKP